MDCEKFVSFVKHLYDYLTRVLVIRYLDSDRVPKSNKWFHVCATIEYRVGIFLSIRSRSDKLLRCSSFGYISTYVSPIRGCDIVQRFTVVDFGARRTNPSLSIRHRLSSCFFYRSVSRCASWNTFFVVQPFRRVRSFTNGTARAVNAPWAFVGYAEQIRAHDSRTGCARNFPSLVGERVERLEVEKTRKKNGIRRDPFSQGSLESFRCSRCVSLHFFFFYGL